MVSKIISFNILIPSCGEGYVTLGFLEETHENVGKCWEKHGKRTSTTWKTPKN